LNAPKLSPSLFKNKKIIFENKMERYSPLVVYGHDADVCHKITAPALRVKPATSNLWATFRERKTGCLFQIGLS
jgi:hypothetical protein